MAFYLRRAFDDAQDILVFNDLRLERNGEFAQIDHLVLHRFGFAIIESKSVTSEITVNSQGEFARVINGQRSGMHSPIRQARLQAELLSKLLNDHKESLRRKVLFGMQQGYFGEERFRVFVAISDRGIIRREKCDPEELCKADTITEKIQKTIGSYSQMTGFGGFMKLLVADRKTSKELEKNILPPLTDEELEGLKTFLLQHHAPLVQNTATEVIESNVVQPLSVVNSPTEQIPVPRTENSARCRHCSRANLAVVYGKFGYYYKCLDCQGNTPANPACPGCGEKAKISKSGKVFSVVCGKCGGTCILHVNPA